MWFWARAWPHDPKLTGVTNQPPGQPWAQGAGYGQQPGYPQAHHAQPLPGLYPGYGLVRVHIKGSVMTSSLIVPTLLLDGGQVPSRYGENAYQVPAGRHRVELYAQWIRRYGQAGIEVDVPPGSVVDVHYAAPFHQFTTGSIGFTPQARKGVGFFVVTMAILAVVLGSVIGGALFG